MKGKRRAAFYGMITVVLCFILLIVFFSFIRVKSAFTDLSALLLSYHDENMRSVMDLSARVSALNEAVSSGCKQNAHGILALETGQRSLNGRLDTLNRRLFADLASDIAALSRRQAVLTSALQESGLRPEDPKDDLYVQSLFRKGFACFGEERYGQAAAYMSEVLSLAPDYPEARLIHAVAGYRENPLDSDLREQIKADLAVVLSGNPHNLLALETLGSIVLEEQDWHSVRRYYQRLIGLDNRKMDYYRMFVFACRAEGVIEDASEEISILLQDDPGNSRYLLYRGEALEQRGEYDQAFSFYEASCRRDPAYLPGLLGAARTAVYTGDYLSARELLASPSVPKNYETCELLAECSKNLGDGESAVTWWKRAADSLTLNTPSDKEKAVACYLNIAQNSFEVADYEGVLDTAAKGLRLIECPELRLIRAKALLKTGRKDQAKEELTLVCRSDADSLLCEEARKLLESLEGGNG